jgi:uncharacterized repeat protein (TIGR03803 family)
VIQHEYCARSTPLFHEKGKTVLTIPRGWRKKSSNPGETSGWSGLEAAFAVFVLCAATAVGSSAKSTFTDLLKFNQTNGANPYSVLVQGTDGNFYGTAASDGAYGDYGTVFKVTAEGKRTTLYSFCSKTGCPDGYSPQAGLVQGTDGNFYGTTLSGGANGKYGTLFKITAQGKLTTLYNFCSQTKCADGSAPYGPLVQSDDGDFYGTTSAGGVHSGGTVFEITPKGKLTTLYTFCSKSNCKDGESPTHGLVLGTDGNFYGTTGEGGTYSAGTVFRITPKGALTTIHSFCAKTNCVDGAYPYAGVVQGTNGTFYGTTTFGGSHGSGAVFTVTVQGKFTVLYNFCIQNACADGEEPYAGLMEGTDGNFYGTTVEGGVAGKGLFTPPNESGTFGTAYKITPKGVLTTLYNFCSKSECADGSFPYAELVQGTNGKFYGTTIYGGNLTCTEGCGTVFGLATGLSPFVETRPSSGKVGAAVIILGSSLTGATSVTFNGTAAEFTIVSASEIKTTVPSGATTGKVTVKTPDGTLSSNVVFRITE